MLLSCGVSTKLKLVLYLPCKHTKNLLLIVVSSYKDANQARPMTAVRGAGYSSAGNRGALFGI